MLEMRNIFVRDTLRDLNLSVKDGEFVLMWGENGAGKTTLFNTIAGFTRPQKGQIFLNGIDVTRQSAAERAVGIAHVFQDPRQGTLGALTIRENLAFALQRGTKRSRALCVSAERDQLFQERLQALDMEFASRLDTRVDALSGGQRQALSLTMALIAPAKIVLLDEVTAALDTVNAEKILDLIEKQYCGASPKTTLMITHNPQHVIRFHRLGAQIVRLARGQIQTSDASEFAKASA